MKFIICSFSDMFDKKATLKFENISDGVELQGYGLVGASSKKAWNTQLKKHRDIRKELTKKLVVHGPFLGMIYNHRDYILHEAVQKRMDITFKMVEELKPSTLVMHTGYNSMIPSFGLETMWVDQLSEYWQQEIKRYENINVTVVLENLLEPAPDMLVQIAENVSSTHFGLCLDVGHLNVFSKLSPVEWVHREGTCLKHVHLHDNNGSADEHLPAGMGNIDFVPFFQVLSKQCPDSTIALEVDEEQDTIIENYHYVKSLYDSVT